MPGLKLAYFNLVSENSLALPFARLVTISNEDLDW